MRAPLAALLAIAASLALPPAAPLPALDDDAGSGRDAPGTPMPLVEIEPGRVYDGTLAGLLLDSSDHYVFSGLAGDVVHTAAAGGEGCLAVLTEDGVRLGGACVIGLQTPPLQATLPADGRYYLRYDAIHPERYRFAIGVNDKAPAVLAEVQDDAGSGRDAPDVPAPFVAVQPGGVYEGAVFTTIILTDVADHYAFEGRAGQTVDVAASGDNGCLAILDAGGAELASGCMDNPFQGNPPLRAVLPADGLHYLRYSSLLPHRYWFTLALDAPARGVPTEPQDDAGSGRDAPDTPIPLLEVRSGQSYQGLLLGGFDSRDHYVFHGAAGDAVDLLATGENACLAILDAEGARLVRRCSYEDGQHHTVRATLPADGAYYFLYDALEPTSYAFSLGVNEDAPDLLLDLQDDAGSGRDAPSTPVPLVRVQPGRVHEGAVFGISVDKVDLYAFEGRAGDVVHVRASAVGPVFLGVVDADGASVSTAIVAAQTGMSAVRATLPADGTYYVSYDAWQPERYWFSLGVNEPAPPLPVNQPFVIF